MAAQTQGGPRKKAIFLACLPLRLDSEYVCHDNDAADGGAAAGVHTDGGDAAAGDDAAAGADGAGGDSTDDNSGVDSNSSLC